MDTGKKGQKGMRKDATKLKYEGTQETWIRVRDKRNVDEMEKMVHDISY